MFLTIYHCVLISAAWSLVGAHLDENGAVDTIHRGQCRQCYWNRKEGCTIKGVVGIAGAQTGPRDEHEGCGGEPVCEVYSMQTSVDTVSYCGAHENVGHKPLVVDAPNDISLASILAEHHQFDPSTVFGGVNAMGGKLTEWRHGDRTETIGFLHLQSLLPVHHERANQQYTITRDLTTLGAPTLLWHISNASTGSSGAFMPTSSTHIPFNPACTHLIMGHATVCIANGIELEAKHWMEHFSIVVVNERATFYPLIQTIGTAAGDMYPKDNELGPVSLPGQFEKFSHELWCAPDRICWDMSHDTRIGCPGTGTCICAPTGTCLENGHCRCHPGYGGFDCAERIDAGFSAHNATACPSFDLCGRRGICEVEPSGVGVSCHCRDGWFGGRANASHYNESWTHTQMVDVYAAVFFCEPMAHAWVDETDWVDSYASLHQCALYHGDLRPTDQLVDGIVPTVPVPPFSCSASVSSGDVDIPLGGRGCSQCPACDQVGSIRTHYNDHSVSPEDVACVEIDARHVSHNSDDHPPMICQCHRSHGGPLCSLLLAPADPVIDFAFKGACGQAAGHGTPSVTNKHTQVEWDAILADGGPDSPWNSSYAGRCHCHDGWGGPNGNCAVELCPHSLTNVVCGTYGECVYNNCTVETVHFTRSQSCIDWCISDVHRTGSTACKADALECCTTDKYMPNPCPDERLEYTTSSQCKTGTCVCSPGWTFDSNGLCEQRKCAFANGLECAGVLVRDGLTGAGASVCDREATHPKCMCDLGPIDAFGVSGLLGACELTADDFCRDDRSGLVCGGAGTCVSSSVAQSSPHCVCHTGFYGRYCDTTVCGSESCSGFGDVTGHCNTGDGTCDCVVAGGIRYHGKDCTSSDQQACVGDNWKMCSGHGDCVESKNIAYPDRCICRDGYTGDHCETLTSCPVSCVSSGYTCDGNDCQCDEATDPGCSNLVCVDELCDIDGGHCSGGYCRCDANHMGADCSVDACTATGGVILSTHVCNCSSMGGVQYPHYGVDRLPYNPFRGCRRPCHKDTDQQECGGAASDGLTRCDGVPMAMNAASGTPACNCALDSINIKTHTMSTWYAEDDTCKPSCEFCPQLESGLCDYALGTSQHFGVNCSIPRCGSHAESHWDGSVCTCYPPWLYTRANGSQTSTDCSVTICDEASFSSNPESHVLDACVCEGAHIVDRDSLSDTFRECKPHCNGFEFNSAENSCSCSPIHPGIHCEQNLCASGYGLSGGVGAGSCSSLFPQYGGQFSNESRCGYGTPRAPPAYGCDCPGGRAGLLCDIDQCSGHGFVFALLNAWACACDGGWSGDECQYNSCGSTLPILPVPCGENTGVVCIAESISYNCDCGSIGISDGANGCIEVQECQNGGYHIANSTNALVCACVDGFTGNTCATHVNGPNQHSRRHTIVQTSVVLMSKFNSSEPLVREFGVFEPACAFPYENLASNCTHINCASIAQANRSAATALIQKTPERCGCINDDLYHIERYNPFVHDAGANILTDTHPMYPRHDDSRDMTKFVCVRNCHHSHTRRVVSETECACHTDWTGHECRLFNGAADDGSGIAKDTDPFDGIRIFMVWVPIGTIAILSIVGRMISVMHKRKIP